ncbi:hypothetical protein Tco_0785126 [Tanacetum coccineum]
MVAYLEKSEGSEGFHEIIDFLSASHIHYALTASPTIYTSLIEQFWQTTALCTIDDGVFGFSETIDRRTLEQLALHGVGYYFDSVIFKRDIFFPTVEVSLFITILPLLSPKEDWLRSMFTTNIAISIGFVR